MKLNGVFCEVFHIKCIRPHITSLDNCCCVMLVFRNVPFDCEEEDIEELFAQFGEIVYCKQVINPDTGVPKGKYDRKYVYTYVHV